MDEAILVEPGACACAGFFIANFHAAPNIKCHFMFKSEKSVICRNRARHITDFSKEKTGSLIYALVY